MRNASALRNRCLTTTVLLCLAALPGCFVVNAELDLLSSKSRPLEERVLTGEGEAKILMVDVTRMISDAEESGSLGFGGRESLLARVTAELEMAAKDDDVKALIVRINSPGGTVTASDILYRKLRSFADERRVPIYAQLMDVAASGGYYTALAADRIVAHPTTVTGSVGVIFYSVNFAGLMDKIGVADQTVKTGARKDIGSPLRTMTAEEKKLIESVLFEMQGRFVGLVRERRAGVNDESAAVFTDGRILSAGQALALGLVDEVGYLEDTIRAARGKVGDADARVVVYRRPNERPETVYPAPAASSAPQINLLNVNLSGMLSGPQFLYLWMPQ